MLDILDTNAKNKTTLTNNNHNTKNNYTKFLKLQVMHEKNQLTYRFNINWNKILANSK